MNVPELTIDEAIADCVRQVPEVQLIGGCSRSLPCCRALWFHAAWVWLIREHPEADVPTSALWAGDGLWGVDHADGSSDGPFPTEYHALRAAVLLAKGLKP